MTTRAIGFWTVLAGATIAFASEGLGNEIAHEILAMGGRMIIFIGAWMIILGGRKKAKAFVQ